MKLQTYIQPRLDGTVIVVGEDGQEHIFKADAEAYGALSCDVTCDATASRLLAGGNFEPVDASDYEKAIALSKAGAEKSAQESGDEDEDDADFSEEINPGGLPIEANTPPAPAKKSAAKKKDD
jgi:hypothetical protein